MLHHLSFGVVDIERACAFYDTVLAPLGYVRAVSYTHLDVYKRQGQFAVVGIELLVQDQEALDLRAAHHRLGRKRAVHLVDMLGDHVVDEIVAGELLIGCLLYTSRCV